MFVVVYKAQLVWLVPRWFADFYLATGDTTNDVPSVVFPVKSKEQYFSELVVCLTFRLVLMLGMPRSKGPYSRLTYMPEPGRAFGVELAWNSLSVRCGALLGRRRILE